MFRILTGKFASVQDRIRISIQGKTSRQMYFRKINITEHPGYRNPSLYNLGD